MSVHAVTLAAGAPIPRPGELLAPDRAAGGRVLVSFPELGARELLVGGADAAALARLAHVADVRPQRTGYRVLWREPRRRAAAGPAPGAGYPTAYGDLLAMAGVTPEIQAAAAYGAHARVCVVDTGVDATHAVFRGCALSALGGEEGARAPDEHGHGTALLSLIRAYAPAARLVAVRALGAPDGTGTELEVARALRALGEHLRRAAARCNIVVLGWQGPRSAVVQAAVRYVLQAPDTLVLCGAGNEVQEEGMDAPADAPGVYVVGACDRRRRPAVFARSDDVDGYHVGVRVTAAAAGSGDGFLDADGTSLAAACVAGLAALHGSAGAGSAAWRHLLGPARQQPLDPPASSGRGLVVLSAADFPAPRRAPAGDAGPDARDAEDHAQAILDLVALGEALARACYDARPRGRATAQALRRALTRLLDEEVDTLWGVLKEIRTHARALAAQRARWEMVEAAAQAAQAALKQALAPDAGALEE